MSGLDSSPQNNVHKTTKPLWRTSHSLFAVTALLFTLAFGFLPFWRTTHMFSSNGQVDYWKSHGVVYGPMYIGSSIPGHIRLEDPFKVYSYKTCRNERSECNAILVRQIFFIISVILSGTATFAAQRRSRRAALLGGVCSVWAAIACSVVLVLYLLSSTHSEYTKIDGMCQSLPEQAIGTLFPEIFAGEPGRCTFISLYICVWFAIVATALHIATAVMMSLRFYHLTAAGMMTSNGDSLNDGKMNEDLEYQENVKSNPEN